MSLNKTIKDPEKIKEQSEKLENQWNYKSMSGPSTEPKRKSMEAFYKPSVKLSEQEHNLLKDYCYWEDKKIGEALIEFIRDGLRRWQSEQAAKTPPE